MTFTSIVIIAVIMLQGWLLLTDPSSREYFINKEVFRDW